MWSLNLWNYIYIFFKTKKTHNTQTEHRIWDRFCITFIDPVCFLLVCVVFPGRGTRLTTTWPSPTASCWSRCAAALMSSSKWVRTLSSLQQLLIIQHLNYVVLKEIIQSPWEKGDCDCQSKTRKKCKHVYFQHVSNCGFIVPKDIMSNHLWTMKTISSYNRAVVYNLSIYRHVTIKFNLKSRMCLWLIFSMKLHYVGIVIISMPQLTRRVCMRYVQYTAYQTYSTLSVSYPTCSPKLTYFVRAGTELESGPDVSPFLKWYILIFNCCFSSYWKLCFLD